MRLRSSIAFAGETERSIMPILGMEQLEFSLRIATILVPICLYFLLLGLLNTRRCPQLLTGRQDFALLMVALSPLAFQPIMGFFGGGVVSLLICTALLGGAVLLLSPRGQTWVIYNITVDEARKIICKSLDDIDLQTRDAGGNLFILPDGPTIEISSFPFLRNVSLRLVDGQSLRQDFEERLHHRLQRIEAEPSPTAMALLLVATGMIVTPLAMMAHQAPEIVRILTGLLP